MASPAIKLNNGLEIPVIGLGGTWQSKPEEVPNAVEYALEEAGYRHIDCAWAYDNEKEVSESIRHSDEPRSEIFITSKLWCAHHHRVEEALDETLANLGTDYLDRTRDVLTDWPIRDTWAQMEAVLAKGKVRAIGVSNFSERILERDLLPLAKVVPTVNQLGLVEYLKLRGIVSQAYSPLNSTGDPLWQDETANALAQQYGLSTADVLLGYLVAKDIVTLPKSVTPARIKSNLEGALAATKKLTKEDIAKLDGVAASGKQNRLIQPPWGVDLGFDNWPVRVQGQ
ncbi:Aldo/keto reductase [Cubamyces lactineus]|nr:Aldo/keto reductase [Cubamyces lactineus]